jgi:hypothetical protein
MIHYLLPELIAHVAQPTHLPDWPCLSLRSVLVARHGRISEGLFHEVYGIRRCGVNLV